MTTHPFGTPVVLSDLPQWTSADIERFLADVRNCFDANARLKRISTCNECGDSWINFEMAEGPDADGRIGGFSSIGPATEGLSIVAKAAMWDFEKRWKVVLCHTAGWSDEKRTFMIERGMGMAVLVNGTVIDLVEDLGYGIDDPEESAGLVRPVHLHAPTGHDDMEFREAFARMSPLLDMHLFGTG